MALTLSGTNGIVGAGFTVDNSGVSVTAGVGTFTSYQGSGASLTDLPAANLTGTLPALSAASLTSIPAANIVGVCTSGLTKTGGFGGGKILQVVHAETDSRTSVGSNTGTFFATNLTADITPSAATSKVLVMVSGDYLIQSNTESFLSIYRGTSNRGHSSYGFLHVSHNGEESAGSFSIVYLDEPSSTSSLTYTLRLARGSGSNNCYVPRNDSGEPALITLMEIGA